MPSPLGCLSTRRIIGVNGEAVRHAVTVLATCITALHAALLKEK